MKKKINALEKEDLFEDGVQEIKQIQSFFTKLEKQKDDDVKTELTRYKQLKQIRKKPQRQTKKRVKFE